MHYIRYIKKLRMTVVTVKGHVTKLQKMALSSALVHSNNTK